MIWIFAFFSKASLSLTLFFAEEKHRCVVFFSRLVVLRKSSIIYNYSIIIVFMYEFLDTCLCSTIRGSDMSHHSVIGTLKMPSFSTKKKGVEPEDAGTSKDSFILGITLNLNLISLMKKKVGWFRMKSVFFNVLFGGERCPFWCVGTLTTSGKFMATMAFIPSLASKESDGFFLGTSCYELSIWWP